VTTSRDNTVRVWPIHRARDEATILRQRQRAGCVAYDPRGASLLTCAGAREVLWWDPSRPGEPRRRLSHRAEVVAAAFAAEGDAIFTVTGDGAVHRHGDDGQHAEVAPAGAHELRRAAYLPASGALLGASLTELAWLQTPGRDEVVLRGHRGTLHALALSPDGALAGTGGSDRSARIWRVDHPDRPTALAPHSGRVTAIAFRPGGGEVATASWDKRIRVWSGEGALRATLTGHEGPVWAVAYSPDGRTIASASEDGTLRIWASDGRGEPVVLRGHEGPVLAAAFRPDGLAIVSGGDDGSARIWNGDFDPASLQRRLWRASPVCLSTRERIRLLAEEPDVAAAASDACEAAAREHEAER
ncbi:MAG: WD40 repeat domain-containing protein, partial [Myxococcales bacterium]|nr:WD40 repeat domain-containing protein [Myxococcales bacterium]